MLLVGNREDDSAIGILKNKGVVARKQTADDDMAALYQAQPWRAFPPQFPGQEFPRPRAGGVHQRPGAHLLASPRAILQLGNPRRTLAPRGETSPPREDFGPMLLRIDGIQRYQPRIIDPAVRIFETDLEPGLEPGGIGRLGEVHPSGGRQALAAAQVIVEKQPQADHPGRPQRPFVGQDEAQRPDDVWRRRKKNLALAQRLANQTKFVVLEIAQAAMDELGAGRGRSTCQITALDQRDGEAPPRGIAGNPDTIDAAADDQEVDERLVRRDSSLQSGILPYMGLGTRPSLFSTRFRSGRALGRG